jgi:sulfatase modifying factor 1
MYFLAVFLCLGLGLSSVFAQTPKRHALLIGNAAYEKLGKIPAAGRNVEALEAALKGAGFDITILRNTTLNELRKAQAECMAKVQPGDAVLIYYSGFATQVRRDNYLLPADYDPATTLENVPFSSQSLTAIRELLDERKPGIKIFVVDAPWEVPQSVAISAPGLSTPDVSDTNEILISFSTQIGQTTQLATSDAATAYTQTLADNIRKPGLPLDDVFLTTQREVARASGQRPYLIPNFTAAFYFRAPLKSDRPDVKYVWKTNRRDRQEYVFIEPGTFQMGCVSADKQCEKGESPQHQVIISKGFWMGRAEVDILAYKRYVGGDSSKQLKMPREAPMWDRRREKENHPIGGATWDEAQAYCTWVGGRLPTEAEWEFAARAGATNQIWPLNSENSRDKANFDGKEGNDLFEYTAPVKSFDPNAFGLFDMAGNMWEWTSDWYSETYYKESPERDPQGPKSGNDRVIRGGSWYSDAKKHLRISIRRPLKPNSAANHVGFRCVLENTPSVLSTLE